MKTRNTLLVLTATAAVAASLSCKPRRDADSALRDDETRSGGNASDAQAFLATCGNQAEVTPDRQLSAQLQAGRIFIADDVIEECIYRDRESLGRDNPVAKDNARYLTLTHLFNHGEPAAKMLVYRAAVSKAINSLSMAPRIVRPSIVDGAGTILRIDLTEYEWTSQARLIHTAITDRWDTVFSDKAVTFQHEEDFTRENGPNFKVHGPYLYRKVSTKYPDLHKFYGRGDWFVVKATIPPLYHALLDLAETDIKVEESILGSRTKLEENIQLGKITRSGFDNSGVSSNNRLLERHQGRFNGKSYYWKSYDFASSVGVLNFKANPFGPCFRTITPRPLTSASTTPLFKKCADLANDAAFEAHKVFKQAGGEAIFSLPNGLQGYLLLKGDGERISSGPPNIVADLSNPTDKLHVINGRSCMFCHFNGMIDGKPDELGDTIRNLLTGDVYWAQGLAKSDLELFARLAFPRETNNKDKIEAFYRQDTATYLAAEKEAVGPGVTLGSNAAETVNQFNTRYYKPVNTNEAAAELGMTTIDFKKFIDEYEISSQNVKRLLQKFNFDPPGNTLNREQWEAIFVDTQKLVSAYRGAPVGNEGSRQGGGGGQGGGACAAGGRAQFDACWYYDQATPGRSCDDVCSHYQLDYDDASSSSYASNVSCRTHFAAMSIPYGGEKDYNGGYGCFVEQGDNAAKIGYRAKAAYSSSAKSQGINRVCACKARSGGNANISPAAANCPGTGAFVYGQVCWYHGAAGKGCNDVCGDAGALYDGQTTQPIGDNEIACRSLFEARGLPWGGVKDYNGGYGCFTEAGDSHAKGYKAKNGSTVGASDNTIRRFCACSKR